MALQCCRPRFKLTKDCQSQNHGNIHIDQHERPEIQHVVDPHSSLPREGKRGVLLRRHPHNDGQHDGIDQRWYRGLISADELKNINPLPQQEEDGNKSEESCKRNAINRPAEGIPIDWADTQFQHQSGNDKASSNEEARP